MGQWVIGLILRGGPIAISHSSQCSTTGVTKVGYVLSCLWGGTYKSTLAANKKEYHM